MGGILKKSATLANHYGQDWNTYTIFVAELGWKLQLSVGVREPLFKFSIKSKARLINSDATFSMPAAPPATIVQQSWSSHGLSDDCDLTFA